jgi:myo-inositol-1(or 4)-monophosphatase
MTNMSRTVGVSPLINVMTTAVHKAARTLLRDFGELEHLQISRKSLGNFVSSADRKVEEILVQELSRVRPEFGILTEESGDIKSSTVNTRFIIDPLDGTSNFLHAIPHFAIAVAVEKDGEVMAAITYDPIKDETFWAEKGAGCFLNQRRLRISTRTEIDMCLLSTSLPSNDRGDKAVFSKIYNCLMPSVSGTRRSGSVALDLAYLAAGRYDIVIETDCKSWDIAGGLLMIKEAGGMITTLDGDAVNAETVQILAANQVLHKNVKELLAN